MALNDDILDFGEMRNESQNKPNVAEYTVSGMTRFGHYVIDSIVMYTVVFGFIFGLSAYGILVIDEDSFIFNLLVYIPFLIYYPIMEFYFGKTVGKMLTKSTVVNEDGSKLTFSRAFGRSLCRFIPFDALSFLGSTAVGWHDSISKTRVVKDSFLDHNLEYDKYSF